MQLFTPLTILLLVATSSLMTGAVSAERALTCDDLLNVHHLKCDSGVIDVQGALYGRADRNICSEDRPASHTACSQQGTVDFVKRRCNAKKECEISINEVRTSDPCRGIYKYLETNYTCLPAIYVVSCEHSRVQLYCEEGQVINVYGADYGRRDTTTCAYKRPSDQTKNTLCFSATTKVADRCNGRNLCTFKVENSLFGDPCVGTYKYLEVAYVCEYPIVSFGH